MDKIVKALEWVTRRVFASDETLTFRVNIHVNMSHTVYTLNYILMLVNFNVCSSFLVYIILDHAAMLDIIWLSWYLHHPNTGHRLWFAWSSHREPTSR